VVTSAFGDKTIRVAVDNVVRHARYGKYIRRRTKVAVHDPDNQAKLGDVVEVVPCRRMSKTKSWRLARIVRSRDLVTEIPTGAETPAAAEPAIDVRTEASK
jgi:small subunit ribosomal protein S17